MSEKLIILEYIDESDFSDDIKKFLSSAIHFEFRNRNKIRDETKRFTYKSKYKKLIDDGVRKD